MKYFAELVITIVSIGYDLLSGLIKGMLSAIPGLDSVVSGIKDKLKGLGDWISGIGSKIGNIASSVGDKLSTPYQGPPGMGGPDTSLLRTPGATNGGVRTERSEVQLRVITPPGARVETTSTGAPVAVQTGGNQAGMAVP